MKNPRVQIGRVQNRYLARLLRKGMMNCYCGEPIKAKSLCQKHYLKDYRERKAAGKIKEKTTLIFDEQIDLWHCKVTGCDDKPRAKQLCTKHYFQQRRAN
jgi:hypothetical protein